MFHPSDIGRQGLLCIKFGLDNRAVVRYAISQQGFVIGDIQWRVGITLNAQCLHTLSIRGIGKWNISIMIRGLNCAGHVWSAYQETDHQRDARDWQSAIPNNVPSFVVPRHSAPHYSQRGKKLPAAETNGSSQGRVKATLSHSLNSKYPP